MRYVIEVSPTSLIIHVPLPEDPNAKIEFEFEFPMAMSIVGFQADGDIGMSLPFDIIPDLIRRGETQG